MRHTVGSLVHTLFEQWSLSVLFKTLEIVEEGFVSSGCTFFLNGLKWAESFSTLYLLTLPLFTKSLDQRLILIT